MMSQKRTPQGVLVVSTVKFCRSGDIFFVYIREEKSISNKNCTQAYIFIAYNEHFSLAYVLCYEMRKICSWLSARFMLHESDLKQLAF
jgi:hypothetical protein